MLRVARSRVPRSVGLREGRAEALPFRDGWFERVVLSLVVHLVERPVAFAEAGRVLGRGARIAIATFAPEHFDGFWLNEWFPSIAAIDRVRFPTAADLERELAAAGFAAARTERLSTARTLSRDEALARVRGRYVSTFDLLDPAELAHGTARLEAELPDAVVTRLEQLVVVAHRR
jgi:SAM-dependent methyltransferase